MKKVKVKRSTITFWVHSVGITLLALLLSRFVVWISTFSFSSMINADEETVMLDMYNAVLNRRAIKRQANVVIVGTDGLLRYDVGDLISLINSCGPAAIGVDILFLSPQDKDSVLIEQIETCSHIVLASYVVAQDPEEQTFRKGEGSYFEDSLFVREDGRPVRFAPANFTTSTKSDVVRYYRPYFVVEGDTLLTFPMAVATELRSFPNHMSERFQVIDYPSKQIEILSGERLLKSEIDRSLLANKVVLLGDVNDVNDTYISPIAENIPGVLIHAYAINTILSSKQPITSSEDWFNWVVAIMLCFVFSMVDVWAKRRFSNINNFLMRLVQVALLFLLFWLGTSWLSNHHCYLDFSAAVLLIGLGALSFDIWYGLYACYYAIYKLIKRKSQ